MKKSNFLGIFAGAALAAACGGGKQAPAVNSFTASPSSVAQGGSVTLQWDVTGATQILIDNGVGDVTGSSSKVVTPTATTTYTLLATGLGGSTPAQVTVTVTNAAPKPLVNSFTADRSSVAPGGSFNLSWTLGGGTVTSVSIDNGVGDVTSATTSGQGTRQVTAPSNAAVGSTLTYRITATGPGGSDSREVSLGVHSAQLRVDYTDPPAGTGKIRLQKDAANSTNTTLVLDVVVGSAPVTGFGVALNLPWNNERAQLNANALTFTSSLDPGSSPATAKALAPATGPLAGILTLGVARKKQFANDGDQTWAAGTKLFSLKIDVNSATNTGTIFDASTIAQEQLKKRFRANVIKKDGTVAVDAADFAIGTLYTSL